MRRARSRTGGAVVPRASVLVDSGAWIALLRARDQHHTEAEELFRAAIRQRVALFTTNLIVAEVHRFLLFHAGIAPAALFLGRLAASPALTVEFPAATIHDAARSWLARLSDQKLTYTDAVSFAVMNARGSTMAMSFDHDFVVAGFSLWHPGVN